MATACLEMKFSTITQLWIPNRIAKRFISTKTSPGHCWFQGGETGLREKKKSVLERR